MDSRSLGCGLSSACTQMELSTEGTRFNARFSELAIMNHVDLPEYFAEGSIMMRIIMRLTI